MTNRFKLITATMLSLIEAFSLNAYAERGDYNVNYYGQTVDSLIIDFMKENNIPGMSLAIVQAPYIPRVVGYGQSDTTTKQLVSDHTIFNLGQMTNGYTAVAIMQLKEEKKLKLEDKISSYIADTPKAWEEITLFDLLTHSSGLPNYVEANGFDYSKEYKPLDIVKMVKDKPLLFKPGSQAQYSSTNHYLLGMVIEKASGIKYEEYVTKKQIEPLGLKDTYFISNVKDLENEIPKNPKAGFKHSDFKHKPILINPTEAASGYNTKNENAKKLSWGATFADSGILASARDVSIWDIGLAGDILVKEEANRNILYKPVKLRNGSVVPNSTGWHFPGHPGLLHIKGSVPGYTSYLSRFTDAKELVCVTLLANKENVVGIDILARKIAGAFDIKLAAPNGASWSNTIQSPYSVAETLERLSNIVKKNGGKIFNVVDHTKEAKNVGEKMDDIQVLSFGNPLNGTGFMQKNPLIALDLPLRAMAWKDKNGEVWLSYTDPIELAKEYNIKDEEALKQMSDNVLKACLKAVGEY